MHNKLWLWEEVQETVKDKIVEKMTGVEIMLMNGDKMKSEEVLDVGSYYYLLNGKHITSIKKTQVAQIQWKTRKTTNDSSKYIRGNNA